MPSYGPGIVAFATSGTPGRTALSELEGVSVTSPTGPPALQPTTLALREGRHQPADLREPGGATIRRRKLCVLFGCILAFASRADDARSPDDVDGPPSPYSAVIARIARAPDGPSLPTPLGVPVAITCYETRDDQKYVGASQTMNIDAPLAEVARILDDIPHFKDLFPGCVDVRVIDRSRDGTRFVTAREQRVPVFFIPNTRYQLSTVVDRSTPGRVVYRYRLLQSDDVTNSDGVVILVADGPTRTRYTEVDFFRARWGWLPTHLVWSKSLRGIFLSDVAVKLKAEHPDWSYAQVGEAADGLFRDARGELERCLADRRAAASLDGAFTVGGNSRVPARLPYVSRDAGDAWETAGTAGEPPAVRNH